MTAWGLPQLGVLTTAMHSPSCHSSEVSRSLLRLDFQILHKPATHTIGALEASELVNQHSHRTTMWDNELLFTGFTRDRHGYCMVRACLKHTPYQGKTSWAASRSRQGKCSYLDSRVQVGYEFYKSPPQPLHPRPDKCPNPISFSNKS